METSWKCSAQSLECAFKKLSVKELGGNCWTNAAVMSSMTYVFLYFYIYCTYFKCITFIALKAYNA